MKKTILVLIVLASLAVGAFGFLKVYSQGKPFFNMFSMAEEISQSEDSLLNYKSKMDRVLDKIKLEQSPAEKYFVTTTFSKYVSKNEIEKNVMFYDEKLLLDMLMRNDAKFKGFTAVIANMQNQDIQRLKNDEMVFLIDASADTHFVRNPEHEKANSWDGYAPSVFSSLEKFNLVKP